METITRSATPPLQQTSVCHLSYDADNNLAGYSDGETSAEYDYDDLGRKIWEKVNYGDFTKEFFYSYYKNGLKKTFTAPDGTMYEYSFGKNNELREVRIPGLGAITIPDYTWNRPAKMVFPGGTQRTYGYDALMRLQSLTVTDPGGNSLLDYAYTYDSTGNIVTKATEHGTYGYDYDASSRLTDVDNPVLDDESYTYDAVGNRLTSADVSGSWSYNTNNELLGFADMEYEYDDNGNMTQTKVAGQVMWTYTYDAANRLVHVEDGTGSISADYYYDPFGRRLWKDVGGTRTYFFYSDEGLIGEYDASGNEIKTYGYKPDSTWTTDPLWLKKDGQYYFYQNDHLGTPQKLVAMNGAVVWAALYSSFGEAVVEVETITNNIRFPGQYCDDETGLHYNWFRHYDPKSGRYLQADPLKFLSGDANPYRSVWSNPVNWFDPAGLFSSEPSTANTLMQTVDAATRNPEVVTTAGAASTGVLTSIGATLFAPVAELGAVTVGGSVALALGAGLLIGTGINEFVVEPYITEPLFDRWFPVHEPDSKAVPLPQPSPAPSPNPVPQGTGEGCCEDEAGESCSCRELGPIILYAVRPGHHPTVRIGHAFVAWRSSWEIGVEAWGWTFIPESANSITDPKVGMAVGNMDLILSAEPLRVYTACPATMEKLDRSVKEDNRGGIYQVQNIGGRNCFGWAFQVIQDANLSPPRSPGMIFEPSAPVPPHDEHAKNVFFTQIGQFINQLIDAIQRGTP